MAESERFSDIKHRLSVDYLLRTTQQHHVQLSIMADQKANILIGITLIIQTLVFGQYPKSGLRIELLTLSLFSFIATCLALYAVLPALKRSRNLRTSEPNPLFFSYFSSLGIDQYLDQMDKVFKDDCKVYETLLKDIYQLGCVLEFKKYKYIRYSYMTLIVGLIISFSIFAVQSLMKLF